MAAGGQHRDSPVRLPYLYGTCHCCHCRAPLRLRIAELMTGPGDDLLALPGPTVDAGLGASGRTDCLVLARFPAAGGALQ